MIRKNSRNSAKEIRAIRKPPEVEVIAPAQQIDDQIHGQDSIEQHLEYMPGKMTIETATGQNRPPENEIPITPELQIERFFEALNRGDKERVLTCDTKAATYLLEARYQDVRIRNGNFNYQANSTGIMFNPGSYMECAFTWNELAHELIKRFGKKRKPVKMVYIDAPENAEDIIAAVKAFCEAYPEKLKTIMRICRQYDTNREAAEKVQKKMAPCGYSRYTGVEVEYTFMSFTKGLDITLKGETVKIKYNSFIVELKRLYDPYSPEFDDEEERCFQAADQEENAAEKQQTDHFVEPNKIDHPGEATEMPWPEELIDIQTPTETEITGYLYDEQRKLKEIEESRQPWMEVYRQQLIVAGLKLVKKLVKN